MTIGYDRSDGRATGPGRRTIALGDPQTFAEGPPYAELAELRASDPVHWVDDAETGGFWAVLRHRDVVAVSRRPEVFSSRERGAMLRTPTSTTDEVALEQRRRMLIHMDPPEHTSLRRIVQRAFTPAAITALAPRCRELARRIVTEAADEARTGDLVDDIAARLPLEMIAELMGIPAGDRDAVFDWATRVLAIDDPSLGGSVKDGEVAAAELFRYANDLARQKRDSGDHDLVTMLLSSEVEGERLSTVEFDLFFLLLTVAGNQTTRDTISHGVLALLQHPDQWERLKADRAVLEPAVEEILRWASPVIQFQRTAVQDDELDGTRIRRGDRVVLYYPSANRDPDVFDEPDRFDVTRRPNPHLAFGGGGPHFCLGANLARVQLHALFEALADLVPGIELAGSAQRLRSVFVNGITSLPVTYRP